MEEKIYKIAVIGPTGAGKSQFCNFCLKDIKNSTYTVSDSLNSCTQDPFSADPFIRNNMKIELIDSAGSSDSGDKDIENLKKFVKYLRERKQLDYILLLLRFEDRVTGPTKKFIETLSQIFAPYEFFSHLSIIFTRSPIDPDEDEINKRNKYSLEIGEIIDKIFKIDENHKKLLSSNQSFFIDTKFNKKNNKYDEQSQKTVDIIFDWIKFNLERLDPINTEELEYNEETIKIRRDKELQELNKKIMSLENENLKNKKDLEESKMKYEKELGECEKMKKKLEEVKSATLNKRSSLYGKIIFGFLSGLYFLGTPASLGLFAIPGVAFAAIASKF